MEYNVPKMRTINELAAIIKEQDACTKVTAKTIRKLILTGQLPCVKVGCKYLVSIETFQEFLKGETLPAKSNNETKIKPIAI